MPAGDGTGPMGMGAMTGRAAGYCAGFGMPGYNNSIPGRGCGRGRGGRGGGRGHRNMFYATGMTGWQRPATGWPMSGGVAPTTVGPTREQQLDALKSQAAYFEGALGDVGKRIEELKAQNTEK